MHELFGFERPVSKGERVHLVAFELLVIALILNVIWEWAAELPQLDHVVRPLGIANWIDVRFMFGPSAGRINAGSITLALGLGFFNVFRPAYGLALLGLHLQYVARYSLGKVAHGPTLTGLALLGLGLGALLERDRLSAKRFAFGFSVLTSGIGYFCAAMSKMIATGPTWSDGRHLAIWITERGIDGIGKRGVLEYNALQEVLLGSPVLSTFVLTFGLLAEACAVLAVFRRYRPFALGALVGMHVGVWLSMDILFDMNLALLTLLAIPAERFGLADGEAARDRQDVLLAG